MLRRALKILFWILLAAVLFVTGVLIGAVRILTPERLTPLAAAAANRLLNADVTLGQAELSLRGAKPLLTLDIDSLTIASRDIRSLPPAARDTLPCWADTLLDVRHLHGALNIFRLATHVIDLRDLSIVEPQVNILVVNENLNNFSIARPSTDEAPDTTPAKVPDIRLNRFALEHPRTIRYADMAQNISANVHITTAHLENTSAEPGNYVPLYKFEFESDITSPLLRYIERADVPVGFDGTVQWSHEAPCEIKFSDFRLQLSELKSRVNTTLDFTDRLTVSALDFEVMPLSVSTLLGMIPQREAEAMEISTDIVTDAAIKASGRLVKPYTAGTEELPALDVRVEIPPCSLRWEQLQLHSLAFDATAAVRGTSLNDASVDIRRLAAAGPSAEASLSGRITRLLDDPLFDGEIKGTVDLKKLPSAITSKMGGAIKGRIDAATRIVAAPSMFSRNNFHRLRLDGDVTLSDFSYLADDTLTLYSARTAKARFGTNESVKGADGAKVDSLLSAKLTVDTAYILVSGLDIQLKNLALGIGAQNRKVASDTTAIIPMGGGIKADYFTLFSMGDSAGVRMRSLNGSITMRRYKGDAHLPVFDLNAGVKLISTGSNHTRFMVSDSRLKINANKLPDSELEAPRRQLRHLADSLRRRHPDIPIDSVYEMALEIRRRNRRPGHRVHTTMADDNELLLWGTSSGLKHLLLNWNINGSITAARAGLYTPSVPLRNRMENLNIRFCNDSISLTNVAYKAGGSDFLISGNISNLKRAFTRPSARQPLKVNFSMFSDMIDVNEIANAFFTGAANKDARIDVSQTDEAALQKQIDNESRSDSVGPLLIPTNIDAELKLRANHIRYSDIQLNDFSGTVLVYDGAINLHDLQASSQVGSLSLSALYSAPNDRDMDFGFGMKLSRFNIAHFLDLVPAVDSIMPLMRDLSGIINADIAATSKINPQMNIVMPTLHAAINISGDSLVVMDKETFKTISKWLLFKDKDRNMINHVSAELLVEDDQLKVYPFIFDFDRYRLGIQGSNDLDLNFKYHVAVLKSPIPFKFGINVSGTPDKFKIRLGRAHFNEKTTSSRALIVDTTRINLINQFENVFRRGVSRSNFATLEISDRPNAEDIDLENDTISAADSLYFKQQGLIHSEGSP